MKKIILSIFLLCSFFCFADELRDVVISGSGEESTAFICYDNNEAYIVLPFVGEYAKLDKSVFFIDKDGYLKFKYKQNQLVIVDSEINQFIFNFSWYKNDNKIKFQKLTLQSSIIAAKNLKDITASSFLTEKVKGQELEYSPDNLYQGIITIDHGYFWNSEHLPWVEGAPGSGIGETITIEYNSPVIGLSILNGYVEEQNLKLYKENSRLKEIEIENLKTGKKQIAKFEDRVYFKYILLDEPAEKIKITIKDVYPGSKYSDTCVTAIHGHWAREESYLKTYFEEGKNNWHLESQKTVLADCFSGMDLWKNKYEEPRPEDEK